MTQWIVLTALALILVSLGFALVSLVKGDDKTKAAKALTLRIILSLLLFIGILFAMSMGWLSPNPGPLSGL